MQPTFLFGSLFPFSFSFIIKQHRIHVQQKKHAANVQIKVVCFVKRWWDVRRDNLSHRKRCAHNNQEFAV